MSAVSTVLLILLEYTEKALINAGNRAVMYSGERIDERLYSCERILSML